MAIRVSRSSLFTHFVIVVLYLGTVASGIPLVGCGGSGTELNSAPAALIDEQCEFFDVDGQVQICHHTSSVNHPFVIIKTSVQACINGHAGHAQDYVAVGDPTCQGGGCLPETAPCDETLPCCDGTTCVSGVCARLADLHISETSATTRLNPGFLTAIGIANNDGPDAAPGVTVAITVATSGFTLTNVTDTDCVSGTPTSTCTLGPAAAFDSVDVLKRYIMPALATGSVTFTFTFTAIGATDPNLGNNTESRLCNFLLGVPLDC
jgi:hypothetical protein